MRICLAQTSPKLGDVDANLTSIEKAARDGAAGGASLVVFPELALTGYRLRDLVPHVAVRLDRAGPVRDRLSALSRQVPVVIGLVEETADHRFFNSAVHFEDGEAVHVHRKCYLPTYGMFDEAMDFAVGQRLAAYDCSSGRLGLLVCEDAWHPASATVLAQDGALLLIVLSSSPLRGLGAGTEVLSQHSWLQLVKTLARFHTTAAIWVNRAGFEDGLAYAGASFALAPSGRVIAEARRLAPELLIAEIDMDEVRSARAAYPLVRDERPELIARELSRILRERQGGDDR